MSFSHLPEDDGKTVCLAAVDPGKVNPAAWVGLFDMESNTVTTKWGAAGQDIISALEDEGQKPTICEVGAKIGEMLVDKCKGLDLCGVVVETPSTFNGPGAFVNVSAAVGAGATFGFLRGVGVKNVRMSHSRTKAKAIEYFSEAMGIGDKLERHLPGADKATKARNRLTNKRNAKMVVQKLFEVSMDSAGQELLDAHHDKKDDLCDAVLLACGLGLDIFTVNKKKKKKTAGASRKKKVEKISL